MAPLHFVNNVFVKIELYENFLQSSALKLKILTGFFGLIGCPVGEWSPCNCYCCNSDIIFSKGFQVGQPM